MRTPHIGEETITELKQREIQKKVRQILQILKWGRDPDMLILCDKELHKDTRHAMVQAYIEICELLDCTPVSMTWNIKEEEDASN